MEMDEKTRKLTLRLLETAKRICLLTGPGTPYARGDFSRPLVDAVQYLRHAVVAMGQEIATDWDYDVESQGVFNHENEPKESLGYIVCATSREGLTYRYMTVFPTEAAAQGFKDRCPAAEVFQPSLQNGWLPCALWDEEFFRTATDDGPYAFFEDGQELPEFDSELA